MGTFVNTALWLLLMPCLALSLPAVTSSWKGKQAEVYFAIDQSSSVKYTPFRKMTRLVADLVDEMDIGADLTRVGVGLFSTRFTDMIPLNNKLSKDSLVQKIRGIVYQGGHSYLSRGLEGMRRALRPSATRPNTPRIAVFITDGESYLPYLTSLNATATKNDGIFVFAIGIGDVVSQRELSKISSDPKRDFMYQLDSFDELEEIRPQLSSKMAGVQLYLNDRGTCGSKNKMDTVFVYDEAALGDALTSSVNSFLKDIAVELRINPGDVRVGVVSKSHRDDGEDIMFGDFVTREDFTKALDDRRSSPRIGSMLYEARTRYFDTANGHRSDAEMRLVFILTHSLDKETRRDVLKELIWAKYLNKIKVYIIRHGNDYNKEFLENVASSPKHILYEDIDKAYKPFIQMFCRYDM